VYINKHPVVFFISSLAFLTLMEWLRRVSSLDYRLAAIAWVLAIGVFVYTSYILINDFTFESSYFKHIYYVFILYQVFIVLHGLMGGIKLGFTDIWGVWQNNYIIWPLLIPLFVFFNKKIDTYVILFDWIYIVGIVSFFIFLLFPFILVNREPAELLIPGLTYGCGILLFYATYLSDRKVNVAFIVINIAFLAFVYLARRNNILSIAGFLIFAYIVNLRNSQRPILFKLYPLLLSFLILFAVSFTSVTGALTQKIAERLTEDTRSDLLVPFFIEMDDYLYFGKGMQGTYYYPFSGEIEDQGIVFGEVEYRDIIEVGYLQLYLNGGIVYILLFLLVLLPAAVNGVFRSSNLFSKACGLIIFLWLIDMFAFGLPFLSFHYIFVWICVGICYKTSFRRKTDDEIRLVFRNSAFK